MKTKHGARLIVRMRAIAFVVVIVGLTGISFKFGDYLGDRYKGARVSSGVAPAPAELSVSYFATVAR